MPTAWAAPTSHWGPICPLETPSTYDPDTVWSFEVGAKSSLADGRVQIDGSLFHMIWRNLQMPIPFPHVVSAT